MYRIKIFNAISSMGLERFNDRQFQLGSDISDPHAYILRSKKLHEEPVPESLLAVARAGAGYNNIPVADFSNRGVVVFNTPGANANAVKELVMAGLILSSRGIFEGVNYVQSLTGISDATELSMLLEKEKKRFGGNEIHGKVLGIIGLGAIGSMVANLALELGMRVIGFDPAISVEAAWQLSSQVEKVDSLQALLTEVDYISLHVPANKHTIGLLNEQSLAKVKPGAKLLNFARDQVVDTQAVIAALDSGVLSSYATDFPEPALLGRKDALLMPHIGASTQEAEENCAVMAANQLIEFLINGNIVNSVNFPNTRMKRNGGHRITFCNENIPRVLGTVLSGLADRNINVLDMVNRSRGDIAYNIIDVESRPDAEVLAEILKADGVKKLRLI
ncbi:MAG: D-3-phosphoglycerate dehydrogenase [Lysobacterales bacterium]|jgi:D-3-phosphoglycerate dehydrogenase